MIAKGAQSRGGRTNLVLGRYAQTAAMLLSAPMLARFLGPESRGTLAVVLLIDTALTQVVQFGLPQAAGRYVARSDAGGETAAATVMASLRNIFVRILLITMVLATLISLLAPWENRLLLGFIVLAAPVNAFTELQRQILVGMRRFGISNSSLVLPAWALVVYLVVMRGSASVGGCVVALVVARLSVAGLLSRMISHGGRSNPKVRKDLIAYGLKTLPSTLGQLGTQRVDTVWLAALSSPSAVGIYAVAAAAPTALYPLAIGLANHLFRSVSSTGAANGHSDRERRSALILIGGLSVGAALMVPFVYPLAFGTEYQAAIVPAIALVPTGFLYADFMLYRAVQDGRGLPADGSIAQWSGFLLAVAVVPVFALRSDLLGVAAAMVLAAVVRSGVLRLLVRRSVQMSTVNSKE